MNGVPGVLASLVRKEFYLIRRDRKMLVLSIVAPILQVLLLGYAATTDIRGSKLIVADLDRTAESRDFVKTFTSTEYFSYAFKADNFDEVDAYLMRGEASAALLIPPRFGDHLLAGTPAAVQLILDGTDANTASVLLGYAMQIVGSWSQSIRPEVRIAGAPPLPGTMAGAEVCSTPT